MRIKIISAILLLFITGSCITTSQEQDEKRLSLFFTAEGLGEVIEIDTNEIIIEEFKFSLDRFNLVGGDDFVLQSSSAVTAFIFAYDDTFFDERLILDVGLGFSDTDMFDGYEIFLEPVASRTGILDQDFFGEDDETYSVIIKGTVNEVGFVFQSTGSFEKSFDLGMINLSTTEPTLRIDKSISMSNLFIGEEGEFLNPASSEDNEEIISNIERDMVVEASASPYIF